MTDQTQEIYRELLELYIFDLEVELLAEKLKNVNTGTPPIVVPYPWQQPNNPWNPPPYYYYKTSGTTNNGEII